MSFLYFSFSLRRKRRHGGVSFDICVKEIKIHFRPIYYNICFYVYTYLDIYINVYCKYVLDRNIDTPEPVK